jgi:hypothetical protein
MQRFERERDMVLLTGILIPDPLFPALAIRRRYLAFSHARDIECTQTIKRDSHSKKNPNQPNTGQTYCTPKGLKSSRKLERGGEKNVHT